MFAAIDCAYEVCIGNPCVYMCCVCEHIYMYMCRHWLLNASFRQHLTVFIAVLRWRLIQF